MSLIDELGRLLGEDGLLTVPLDSVCLQLDWLHHRHHFRFFYFARVTLVTLVNFYFFEWLFVIAAVGHLIAGFIRGDLIAFLVVGVVLQKVVIRDGQSFLLLFPLQG